MSGLTVKAITFEVSEPWKALCSKLQFLLCLKTLIANSGKDEIWFSLAMNIGSKPIQEDELYIDESAAGNSFHFTVFQSFKQHDKDSA